MIVDYDIFSSAFINVLKNNYGLNYVSVDDIEKTLVSMRPHLIAAPMLTQDMKDRIKSLSEKELLSEIAECFEHVTDIWDRDNLMLLKFMCEQYEYMTGTSRFEFYTRLYDNVDNKTSGCSGACSTDLYGAFMSILRDKAHHRYEVLYGAVVSINLQPKHGYRPNYKRHNVIYKSKVSPKPDMMSADSYQGVMDETNEDIVEAIW